MPFPILLAILKFACWEAALFGAAMRIAKLLGWDDTAAAETWLVVLAIELTLESSFAALFTFARINSPAAYGIVGAICLIFALAGGIPKLAATTAPRSAALAAALLTPLVFLSFRPVEEIDSINYLHYLIDWMANRATPYVFATNYVAFWELSFLPAWMVTGVDLFFPLLALKSLILLALALWLVGEELGMPPTLRLWTILASLTMRHFWFDYSGVPTLKNDALHGVGFVLMALVVLRAARGKLAPKGILLLGLGAALACVKYTGIFEAGLAIALVAILARKTFRLPIVFAATALFLLTSGHYYMSNLVRFGSPFYPFQINIAFIHLPGTADLSNTSILYSVRDPRLWRALFLPEGGISPAGILFPLALAAVLLVSTFICFRAAVNWLRSVNPPTPAEWTAFLLLAGWLLYFRSVFSASASAGDLAFIVNNLNSVRYVDGVLALSELFLVCLLARISWLAWGLVAIQLASRLYLLYPKLPADLFPPLLVAATAITALVAFAALRRYTLALAGITLLIASPILVERNRAHWTTYWNDLKPALQAVRGSDLAELALEDGGYFAGHVVAAGNPVNPGVRTLLPADLDALAPAARPRYLAVMLTPGSEAGRDWRARHAPQLGAWGYLPKVECASGALFERSFR